MTERIDPSVWAAAQAEYLSGATGAEVCARFGLRRSTFHARAADEGWRRADRAARTIDDAPRSAPLVAARPSAELAEVALAHATRAIGLGHLGQARGWTRLVGALRRMAMEETDCGTWAAALDRAVGAPLRRQAEMADRESGLPDSARTEQSLLTPSPAFEIPDLPDSVDSFAESGSLTDQRPCSPAPGKRPAALMPGGRLKKRSPKPGRTTKAARKQPSRSKLEMARQISSLGP